MKGGEIMKKVLSLLLSITLLFSLISNISISAYADNSDLWYRVLDNNTAEIWNYGGSDAEVIIPSELDGYTVTSIAYPGFSSNMSVMSVYIPDTITNIGSEAFANCQSLEYINVDSNNKYYSSQDGVLFNRTGTELIQFPIGSTNTSYTISNTVLSINELAFNYSKKLKYVTIPDNVAYINNAFNGCNGLESINVSDSNRYFSSQDGVLFNKNKTQLLQYPISSQRETYEMPSSVGNICYRAFYNCQTLKNITIPNSVTYIGYEAFAYCYALESLIVPGTVECIDSRAFVSCSGLTSAVIKDGVNEIESAAFSNCFSLTTMTIPASVTYIGNLAFSNCSALKCVTILNPNCTFAVCKNLIPPNSAMRGYENSTAQTYASTYGRVFTVIDKYTVDSLGASIRVFNPGLRFGFSFDKSQSADVEEYGFVYMYSESDNFIVDTNAVKKLTASNILDDGDCVTFNIVFTNIPKSAYDQIVSVRAYVKIDGDYYYSDALQRSFSSVANAVLADSEISQDTKDKINDLLS